MLLERWGALVAQSEGILGDVEAGRPFSRYGRVAAEQVRTLSLEAKPEAICDTALAVFMMAEGSPSRFRSDRGLDFQVVRRVRALARTHQGTWWDQKEGRVKRFYRDPLPKSVAILGGWLREAFAGPGAQLARLDARDRIDLAAEARKRAQELATALEVLR